MNKNTHLLENSLYNAMKKTLNKKNIYFVYWAFLTQREFHNNSEFNDNFLAYFSTWGTKNNSTSKVN